MNENPAVLLSPLGREALTRAAELLGDAPGSELAVAAALRREYPASLAAAAVAQHELRLAARGKFSRAMEMLFTRAGYEQSSSETIAWHRAARFGGARRIADLCCGIGGDLIALAAAPPPTATRSMPGLPSTTPASTAKLTGFAPASRTCATSHWTASTRRSSTRPAGPGRAGFPPGCRSRRSTGASPSRAGSPLSASRPRPACPPS